MLDQPSGQEGQPLAEELRRRQKGSRQVGQKQGARLYGGCSCGTIF